MFLNILLLTTFYYKYHNIILLIEVVFKDILLSIIYYYVFDVHKLLLLNLTKLYFCNNYININRLFFFSKTMFSSFIIEFVIYSFFYL